MEEILKAMEMNRYLQMTYFAKAVPTLDLSVEPDVTVVRSTIPDDTFNYVLTARFTSNNAAKRVSEVLELYANPPVPFSWWLGPLDTPKNLSAILIAQNLTCKEENVGMYLDLSQFVPTEDHSELKFEQVINSSQLQDFAQVIVNIGGCPEAYDKLYSQVPPLLYQEGACLEMHIAYLDGSPAVTGMIVFHANVAGIYYVATDPKQRKKGYGTMMMTYLINRAISKGYKLATLQASRAGKNLYERLGFKECCIFKEYTQTTSKVSF